MHLCWSGTSLFEILDPPLDMYVNNELGIMKLGKVKTKWPKQ